MEKFKNVGKLLNFYLELLKLIMQLLLNFQKEQAPGN